MRLLLLVPLVAAATAGPVGAQLRGGAGPVGPAQHGGPAMRGGFGGPPAGSGFRMVQGYPLPRTSGFGIGGGGYGSGLGYGYWSGGYIPGGVGPSPYYVVPQPAYVPSGGGPAVVRGEPSGATAVSGVLPAKLVVEYPAAAKVWLNGVEVPGDADTTWTFTSRDLRPGETATFRVRGRWSAGGKTFEAERDIPLGPGAQSRLTVILGRELRE